MDKEQAREYITKNAAVYLKPDRSGKGFICPICGSGSGAHGTGITTKDGIHFTCWSGDKCFTNSDIIDIIGLEKGLTDYKSKLEAAAAEFNITIDGWGGGSGFNSAISNKQPAKNNTAAAGRVEPKNADEEKDYSDFYLEANKHIGETNYHRGLTLDTLNRFKVGYTNRYNEDNKAAQGWDALIIPTSKASYVIRNVKLAASSGDRYRKQGHTHIFNAAALYTANKPIFIVEGEIDAMSIIDVGGEAIGLGSVAMVDTLLKILEERSPAQPLIISLDNDETGKNAKNKLIEGLQSLNIPFCAYNPAGEYKDANEALNADRERLRAAIKAGEAAADNAEIEYREAERAKAEAERLELQKEAVLFSIPSFLNEIEESKKKTYISTGFSGLDSIFDGGLYAGLYIVGAISSLGKTTFCLQIADQIAQRGHDVLIFSLEMASIELWAKSISRLSLIGDLSQHNSTVHAKTTRGILTGARYNDYTPTERELINSAIAEYSKYSEHIYITEGVGDVGIAQIKERIEKQIRVTGKPPVVLIDYLQIIAPADVRATDKQNTDKAVLELKRMSRDYKIPVIGISSFNRDNYNEPVNLASFKESGAIEYSSDVLIGLQYKGMDYKEGESDNARKKRIRELTKDAINAAKLGAAQSIQVKVLKNRNGSKGETFLDYYPMFNYFCTAPIKDTENDSNGWERVNSDYK